MRDIRSILRRKYAPKKPLRPTVDTKGLKLSQNGVIMAYIM